MTDRSFRCALARRFLFLTVLSSVLLSPIGRGQAQQHVAPTDPLPPERQRELFRLPDGFEIQLVVAEPRIGQPMNLNFDVRGRLWITHSVEYPYPARGEGVEPRDPRFGAPGDHAPRDRLSVVHHQREDGYADQLVHFADGLNIPIGQVPLGDGSDALVYGIPGIFRCRDTDGDGRGDQRTLVYGGFGNVDTHGMSNGYRRWIDGWIYGCHGFANRSSIRDASGNVVEMQSGNTYRFREDGSRFEQFTWGQVNPFGMTFDPWGNLYDADCHSMPVYLLLRGARYPHFGGAPDALGFGPTMIDHNHGSTGICGPAYYSAEHFPEPYHGNLFICNPVTGRVHRDRLRAEGSTNLVETLPDLVRCDDPWFRPVDALVGPDGALYVADFYNSIIGHYEVPLSHPKRDRHRGRVWRIVHRGADGSAPAPRPMPDLTKLTTGRLVELLGAPNLLVRTLATNYLVDAHAETAAEAVRSALDRSPTHGAHGLWVLERLGRLDDPLLHRLAGHEDALVRVHLTRMLAERPDWRTLESELARRAAADPHPLVRRVAAEALGLHPDVENVAPLLELWRETPSVDTHLIHVVRLALRSHLEDADVASRLDRVSIDHPVDQRRLREIAAAARGDTALEFLLASSDEGEIDVELLRRIVPRVAARGSSAQVTRLVELTRASGVELRDELELFLALHESFRQRGLSLSDSSAADGWLKQLVPRVLSSIENDNQAWKNRPLDGSSSASPWGLRERACGDGVSATMIDSIVNGESLTGVYESRPFAIPERLEFWMCGHNGYPDRDLPSVNHVRLRLVDTGEVVARDVPPRDDTARRYVWDLRRHAGKTGRIEIVDADTGDAYAWIGLGRLRPAVVELPSGTDFDLQSRFLDVPGDWGSPEIARRLAAVVVDRRSTVSLRAAAARAVRRMSGEQAILSALRDILSTGEESDSLRCEAARLLGTFEDAAAREALIEAVARASATLQREAALALCGDQRGARALLDALVAGKASARLLRDELVTERFRSRATPEMQAAADELLKGLPPAEQRIVGMIAQLARGHEGRDTSAERGLVVFRKHCAACHRMGTEGTVVGPQLDGIGHRGIARILEDVLDPNRNVDVAFRSQVVVTADGRVFSAIQRRQEGKVLVMADAQGREVRISEDDVDEIRPSSLSLMPSNFADVIPAAELHDLLTLLLAQRAAEPSGE